MRDKTVLIIKLLVGSVVIGVLIFAYGRIASKTLSPAAVIVPFTQLAHGEQTSVERRVNYRITSADQLSELWGTLQATGTPPVVDFKTHEVLAVFAGSESSTTIAVVKIEDTNKRMVSITLARSVGTCATRPVGVSPYELVAVPATSLQLTHEDAVMTTGCPQ